MVSLLLLFKMKEYNETALKSYAMETVSGPEARNDMIFIGAC